MQLTVPSCAMAPEPMTNSSLGTGGTGASRATSRAVSGWNHQPRDAIQAASSPVMPPVPVVPAASAGS